VLLEALAADMEIGACGDLALFILVVVLEMLRPSAVL
jgi:hypothetical protein